MGLQVSNSNVVDRDQGLGGAVPERIGHAAWASAVRLLHLLRADVDVPPHREVDLDVLVEDVGDFGRLARDSVVGVRFDVQGLEWILEVNVPKGDVSNAVMRLLWGHRSDSHSYPKLDVDVFNQHVLGAPVLGNLKVAIRWFDGNSIVKVGDVDVSDYARGVCILVMQRGYF